MFGGSWVWNPCCGLKGPLFIYLGERTLLTRGGCIMLVMCNTLLWIGGVDVALRSACWCPCMNGNTIDLYWKEKLGGGFIATTGLVLVSCSILIFDSPLIYWIYFYIFKGAWSITKSSLFLIYSSYLLIQDHNSFYVNLFSG